MTKMTATTNDIIAHASERQHQAADPTQNVWVNASAGTGKTKVLTDRVLRLLLPHADGTGHTAPQNILCITFTKAGASEMIARVMRILSQWSVMPDQDLACTLEKLLGRTASLKQMTAAKQLFATIVDLPGGLNITTIHAFCQSVLGRFTIESGLSPNFQLIEGAEAQKLVTTVRHALINDFLAGDLDAETAAAFTFLSKHKNAGQVQQLITAIIRQRHKILSQGTDVAAVRIHLNIAEGESEERIFTAFFDDGVFPKPKIEQLAMAFANGSKTNQKHAETLEKFCTASAEDRRTYLHAYSTIFLNKDGDLPSERAVSKGAQAYNPNALPLFHEEGRRLQRYQDRLARYRLYESTRYLITIARDIVARFETVKQNRNVIDYDDLIHLTHRLFSGASKDWVLFKLDYQIDHILVDEAQDTSPEQWQIIKSLSEEFFSGETHRNDNTDTPRTLFVVGDSKQSIYSFQGADSDTYRDVQSHMQDLITRAGQSYHNIPMDTSFRTVDAVLSYVDTVFAADDLRYALTGQKDHPITHIISRAGHPGRVELWPVYKEPKREDKPPWTLPIFVQDHQDVQAVLANRIAATIRQWLDEGTVLPSVGRAAQAGDVMILVRRREALFDHMIRALKRYHIPVSGADRLVVSDYIAVEDLLAVLSFAYLPEDDLTLACILKSPLVGLTDAEIEDIAYPRGSHSLWQALRNEDNDRNDEGGHNTKMRDVTAWLSPLIPLIRSKSVFQALTHILNTPTPNQGMTGWQAFFARLGMDAQDPLEEVLNVALNYDREDQGAGIQGFIAMMHNNRSDIKREQDSGHDQVRIMTVHASKGLQAPIVICPDTTTLPNERLRAEEGFIWVDHDVEQKTNQKQLPLWPSSKNTYCDVVQDYKSHAADKAYAEYCRLFYVAMTRAEDRLIICGTLNKIQNDITEKSWYGLARAAIDNMSFQQNLWPHDSDYCLDDDAQCVIYETGEGQNDSDHPLAREADTTITIPDWATAFYDTQEKAAHIVKPSQDLEEMDDQESYSPLQRMDNDYRFRRGNVTHTLLQYLPDIAVADRENAAQTYLNTHANDLSGDIRQSIMAEVMAILSAPDFAPYFGEGSMAEVPVSGRIEGNDGQIISGQIDRLLVTESDVWIVDFKSNRPPPQDVKNVPDIYKRQLAAYRALMAQIYPSHNIHCALLWTDGPYMMEL